MNKLERCRKAMEYHERGFNCGQSVLEAFRDLTDLTEDQGRRIATGLGGGFRNGNICGAVSGAVLVLGMLYPHNMEDMTQKAETGKLVKELVSRFKEQFSDKVDCRDLLNDKELQGRAEAEELGAEKHCAMLIVSAVAILYDYLEELKNKE